MSKVITLLCLVLVALYWSQTQKLKSLAIRVARLRCREAGVQLLDHTVVHSKRKLTRDSRGYWRIRREYQFEFTSTGEQRYHGKVILFGNQPTAVELETFSIN